MAFTLANIKRGGTLAPPTILIIGGTGPVHDFNGNKVGEWHFEEDKT